MTVMVPHGAMNLPQNIKFDVSISVASHDLVVHLHIAKAFLTFDRKYNGRKMKKDGRSGAKVRLFPCLKLERALTLACIRQDWCTLRGRRNATACFRGVHAQPTAHERKQLLIR